MATQTFDSNGATGVTADFGTNVGELIEQETHLAELTVAEAGKNIGSTEQKIRLTAGVALLAAAAFAPVSRGWKLAFAAFGASQLVTGSTCHCPLWQAVGVNTRRNERL